MFSQEGNHKWRVQAPSRLSTVLFSKLRRRAPFDRLARMRFVGAIELDSRPLRLLASMRA